MTPRVTVASAVAPLERRLAIRSRTSRCRLTGRLSMAYPPILKRTKIEMTPSLEISTKLTIKGGPVSLPCPYFASSSVTRRFFFFG